MNPPCQRCGAPLHWVAQYQQWYCPTCQAYAQPGPPQVAVQPGYAGGAPARKGTGKGVLVFVVLAVLVVGGGVAAVLLAGGGESGPEGKGSVEELVDATIEALRDGDGARLLRLQVPPEVMKKHLECPDEFWEDMPDGAMQRTYADTIASVWSGIEFDAEISESRELEELEVGDDLGDCRILEPFAMRMIFLVFDYQHDGSSETHEPPLTAVRVNDEWYNLSVGVDVPHTHLDIVADALEDASDEAEESEESEEDSAAEDENPAPKKSAMIAEFRAIRDRACACRDADCARQVTDDLQDLAERASDEKKPTQDELEQIEEISSSLSLCLRTAQAAAPTEVDAAPPPPPPEETKPAATGIPACDRYLAVMERFVTCEGIPASSRDALRESFAAARKSVEQLAAMPEGAKQSAAEGCTQGAEALQESMKAFGCSP